MRSASRPFYPGLLPALVLVTACSPIYVIKAGWAEAKILAGRRPITAVIADSKTDHATREKLVLTVDARDFAVEILGLDAGDSYTTYTELDRDTLALVLSAAHRDRLESKTWWFPIVGRMPYRGFFSMEDALEAKEELEREGFDTYLRATAAFSTLGWFSDPLLSTVLRYDKVGLVQTVLHELAHNHLFVSGRGRFNESFANFVGGVGAVAFFCGTDRNAADAEECRRAEGRWSDARRFSRFLDDFVAEVEGLYGRTDLSAEEKIRRREEVFAAARGRFVAEVQPHFEVSRHQYFLDLPLNNATILARLLYYHRLPDFQALLHEQGGDVRETVEFLTKRAKKAEDPFELLPSSGEPQAAPTDSGE